MKPVARLSLARLPTPIQKLQKTSEKIGKEIFIWRDDLNGFMESGNKLRKLEFLMADAIQQGCDWIITCGGPQSNHTRATAIIARQLGLGISVLTLPKPGYDHSKTPTGNLLLNQIYDSRMIWLNYEDYVKKGSSYEPFLNEEALILKNQGKKPYVIPLGGSNPIGCLGYQSAVAEMLPLWKELTKTDAPDSLFCALGSGGTFVGLELGIQEQKLKTQLYGINVIGPIEIANKYVASLHDSISHNHGINISNKHSHQIDGYVGAGYSITSDSDLEFYIQLAREEGILLDPCYTGKAFQGMLSEIMKNPSQFGEKILFLHSGGTFGTFAYAEQYQNALKTNQSI
jgi:D-cysteine desulfhydrase